MVSGASISRVRDYWDTRPCNIRHSLKQVGTRQYFEEVEQRKYFVEPHIPRFAEFERWRGKRVLEIGCGIGTDTINFARAGALVTAVDISEGSLEIARQRARVFGLDKNIEFYCANAEALSTVVKPAPYDLVYSFGVIHHTPNPERIIEQIRRFYVHPGTSVKIMVYHRYSWKVLWIVLKYGKGSLWKLKQLVATYSEAQLGCPVTHIYSRSEVRKLMEGFEMIDLWVDHIFPYRVSDYREYRYVKEWYFSWMPKLLFRWLEQTFGWHLCITAGVSEPSGSV